ncbi:HD domain-containing protein [Mycolicibacter arupensis]|uniref:Phosphohydrolase n=1 Tax=Mycolicibacter arupensis TaxID=342002 RepID=A0A5C7XZU8_9MYCO|nr:inositol oxygenase family protein [Mycolicibacter arupensis]TXI55089.1 MAG: phosphohydrolase [Mycolicibacter arupensis]
MSSPHFSVSDTLGILRLAAESPYEDEAVNQLQHALQTAQQARDAGSDDVMVAAALLHDIGRAPAVLGYYGEGVHEYVGAKFCAEHISERAAYLVGQHVPAKRYLVATHPAYGDNLSAASIRSLARQGGPMTPAEVAQFQAHEFHKDAAQLRCWDDGAKDRTAITDDLSSYEDLLYRVWSGSTSADPT